VWSAVSFVAAVAMGSAKFEEFLQGGAAMDQHFATSTPDKNMPILMALFAVWNMAVMEASSRAVLPYCEALGQLPPYLQQLEMESLGKSIDKEGQPTGAQGAQIILGGTGTPAQHAFMQALHQGTEIIPAEIILVAKDNQLPDHRNMLQANAVAQAEALAFGKPLSEVEVTETDPVKAAQKTFPGNRPSSLLVLDELTPKTMGELLALYEHKVFSQAMLLNLNPFDQWGVELGKQIAGPLESALGTGPVPQRLPAILKELKKK
jgi:glucose-6-phosphate isomerase